MYNIVSVLKTKKPVKLFITVCIKQHQEKKKLVHYYSYSSLNFLMDVPIKRIEDSHNIFMVISYVHIHLPIHMTVRTTYIHTV